MGFEINTDTELFDYNNICVGKYFIGRSEESHKLRTDFFDEVALGRTRTISLMGMNRIGKSSLIQKEYDRFCATKSRDIYAVLTNLQGKSCFWDLWVMGVFPELFPQIMGDMEEIEATNKAAANIIKDSMAYFENEETLQKLYADDLYTTAAARNKLAMLFASLFLAGKRVMLVWDEFDEAVNFFGPTAGQSSTNFSWLRTLLQNTRNPLSLLTVSRRSIYYIETSACGGSTLSGIFTKLYLNGFKNSDLKVYFDYLEEYNLTDLQKEEILYFCGRSPYHLAIMGRAILDGELAPGVSVAQLFTKHSRDFFDTYDRVINLLDEEKLLRAMLQLFVGPVYDLSLDHIEKLQAMGYIMVWDTLSAETSLEYADFFTGESDRRYLTVSDRFVDYLAEVKRKEVTGMSESLSAAERLVREMIITEYKDMHGEDWEAKLNDDIDSVSGVDGTVDRFYKKFMEQYEAADPERRKALSQTKIQVVGMHIIRNLIGLDFNRYRKYFPGKSWDTVASQFYYLKGARDPLAHSNQELLTDTQIEETNRAIVEIAADISKVLEQNA